MASQVLSGSSNPLYVNNTGQNVRVVINYMASTNGSTGTAPVGTVGVAPTLTINWAGVSVTGALGPAPRVNAPFYSFRTRILRRPTDGTFSGGGPRFAIGRNIASAVVASAFTPGFIESLFDSDPGIGGGDVALTSYANNAGFEMGAITMGISFPTEIMLRPNDIFSAVCGVYNVVIIPENG